MINDLNDVAVAFYDTAEYNRQIQELVMLGYTYSEAHFVVEAREAHDAREYDRWLDRVNYSYVVE